VHRPFPSFIFIYFDSLGSDFALLPFLIVVHVTLSLEWGRVVEATVFVETSSQMPAAS
jgi:hypothetical protein